MRYLMPLILLAGCATAPAPKIETQVVKEPVPVRCVDPAKVPVEPAKTGALPSDARAAADTLAAKVLELRGYGRELIALIGPCEVDPR